MADCLFNIHQQLYSLNKVLELCKTYRKIKNFFPQGSMFKWNRVYLSSAIHWKGPPFIGEDGLICRYPKVILPELRTQNYLFDLIHLHFCYNNTIQYNTVQFMGLFIFPLVKETPIKVR